MNRKHVLLILAAPFILLFVACPLINVPQAEQPPSPAQSGLLTLGAGAETLSVMTDQSRNQGVLVSENGTRIDITAAAEDGTSVTCVNAVGVASISDGAGAKGMVGSQQALIIGTRGDGKPGAWVFSSNKIEPVMDEESGRANSNLPETDEKDGLFRGKFGWVYHVMGISEDSKIIVGYAENQKGFSHGQWKIDAGTTIGVYWRVSKHPQDSHFMVSRARIIGTLDASKLPDNKKAQHWIDWVKKHSLEKFKWFLLGYLTSYLTMVEKDGVHFDAANNVYLVSGTDQDGQPAMATIDTKGNITIAPVQQGGQVDLRPGVMTYTGNSVADGGSLSVSLPIDNLQSGTVSQPFSVDFHLAQTSTFAPTTDATVGSAKVSTSIAGNSSLTVTASLALPTLGVNKAVYIYAVVDPAGVVTETDKTNNTSTSATAAVVLIYQTPGPQTYPVLIETYPGSGSGSTNTGVVLYKDNGDGTVSYVDKDVVNSVGHYGALDYTVSGLASGTYYVMVVSIAQNGPYAFVVRTSNIDRLVFTDLASNAVDPYEPDDTPKVAAGSIITNTTPPSAPALEKVGNALNRYSAANDWDWFTFTLP